MTLHAHLTGISLSPPKNILANEGATGNYREHGGH